MNELRWDPDLTSVFWGIVDETFFPDLTSIQAVNLDVTAPWTANATTRATGRFARERHSA